MDFKHEIGLSTVLNLTATITHFIGSDTSQLTESGLIVWDDSIILDTVNRTLSYEVASGTLDMKTFYALIGVAECYKLKWQEIGPLK